MTVFEVRRLELWEEARGPLSDLRDIDGQLIVTIAGLVISLPSDFKARLKGHIGHSIAVLRTDSDYRMRILG